MLQYLIVEFPLYVRRASLLFLIATGILSSSLFISYHYAKQNTDAVYFLYGESQVRNFSYMYDPEHIKLSSSDIRYSTRQFLYYIFNNGWIAITIFFGGMLFGLGSLVLLVYNGLSMGLLMGHLVANGYGATLWPTIVGHSSFELMGTVISATAGFKLGWSIIGPVSHNLPRLQHIILEFKQSLLLMYGAFVLIIIAGLIEAFWSSSNMITDSIKYISGCLFWLILPLYLWLAGRRHVENL